MSSAALSAIAFILAATALVVVLLVDERTVLATIAVAALAFLSLTLLWADTARRR